MPDGPLDGHEHHPVRIQVRLNVAIVTASLCLGLVFFSFLAAGLYASHTNPIKLYPAGLCSVAQGLGCPVESGAFWSVRPRTLGVGAWRLALASATPDAKWVWNKTASLLSGNAMLMVSFDFSGQAPGNQLVSTDAITGIKLFATVGGSPTYNSGTGKNDNTFKIGLGLYSGGALRSQFYGRCTGASTSDCETDLSYRLASAATGKVYDSGANAIAVNFVTGKAWLYSELRSVVAIIQQTDDLGSLLSVEQIRMEVTASHPLSLSLTTDAPYLSTRGVDPLAGGIDDDGVSTLNSYGYRVVVQHLAGALVSRVRVCLNKNPCGTVSDPGWNPMYRDLGAGDTTFRDGDFTNGEQFLISVGFLQANLNSTQTYYFEAEDAGGRTGRLPIANALPSVYFGPALLVSYASVQIHPSGWWMRPTLGSLWSFCGEPDCGTDQGITDTALYSTALDADDGDEAYAWTAQNAALLSMALESASDNVRNLFKIYGVQARAVARDEEVLTSLQLGFRIAGLDSLVLAPTTDGGAGFSDYAGTLYSLNPKDNQAWAWTDLDSLVILVSHQGTSTLRVTELTADVYLGSVIHPLVISTLSSSGNCCDKPSPGNISWQDALAAHDGNLKLVSVGGGPATGLDSVLYLDLQAPAATVAGPYISYVQVGVVANVTTLFSFSFGVRSKGKDVTEAVEDRAPTAAQGYKTYLSQRYEVDPVTTRAWTWDDIRKLKIVIAPVSKVTPVNGLLVTEAYLLVQDSPIRLGFAGESGLTADGVEPNTGTTTTRFTFKTLYTHTNNQAPNLALFSVVIDGGRLISSFNLAQLLVSSTKNDANWANGELYSATVTGAQLGQGSHDYYFLVSDLSAAGSGAPSAATRLPASGVFHGPDVDTGSGYLTLWPLKSWEGSPYSSFNWRFTGLQSTALDTNDGDATLASTVGTSLQSLYMQMDTPVRPTSLTSQAISFVMVNAVARDNLGSITAFNLGLCSTGCTLASLRSFDRGHVTIGDGLYHTYTSAPFTTIPWKANKAWQWNDIRSIVTIIERPAGWKPLYVTDLFATVGLSPVLHPSGLAATDPGKWSFRGNPATALDKADGNSRYAVHESDQDTQPNDKLYMDFDDPTVGNFFIEGVQMTAVAAPFDINNANCGPANNGSPEGIAVGLQIGGTDFMELASTTQEPDSLYRPFTTALYRTNPATGLAWTWDDISTIVGIVHHTSTCDGANPGQLRVTEMNLVVLYSPIQLSLPTTLASFKTDAVDPDGGSPLTSFMYKVVYTNINNAAPALISLRIDGGTTLSSLFSLQRDSSVTGALNDGNFANGELYSYYPVLFSSYGAHTYHFYASAINDNLTLDSQANRDLTFLPIAPGDVLTGPLVSVGAACIGPNCAFAALYPSDKNALSDSGWGLGVKTLLWPTALDVNDGNTSLVSSCTSGDDLYLDMDDPDPGLASFSIELVSATVLANNVTWTGCTPATGSNTGFKMGIVTTGVAGGETPLVSLSTGSATYLVSSALWSVGPAGPRWSWDEIKNAQVHIAHNDGKPLRITEAYLSVKVSPIGLSFSPASGYTSDGVDPDGGLASLTSFVFRVVYANTNNVAPTLVSVRIDGNTLGSAMTLETAGTPNYRYGVLYSYQADACFPASASCRLYPGLHSYFFEAQAEGVTAVWPLGATALASRGLSGPAIQSLTLVPLLSYTPQGGFGQDLESDSDGINGRGVHPNRGLLTTLFSFKVAYTSPNNIAPSFVRLHMDADALPGSPFAMTVDTLASAALYRDGDYRNSEQFTTALLSFQSDPKTHTYYFAASDLVSTALRLPATGALVGPLVSDVLVSTKRLHPSGACTTSGPTACPPTTWTSPTNFATAMDTRDGTTGTTGTYARAAAPALGRRMFMEMDDPSFTNTTGLRIESVAVTAAVRSSGVVSYEIGICLSACATADQLWSTRGTRGGLFSNNFPSPFPTFDCGTTNEPRNRCLTEIFRAKPGGGTWKVEDIANVRALVSHRGANGAATNLTMDVTELYLTVTFTNTLSLDYCTAAANCAETGYGVDDGVNPNAGPSPSNFAYKAVYSHGSNVAPNLISVWIDGTLYSMARDTLCTATGGLMRDCDYTNGELYSLMSVGMTARLHSYYFTATTGTDLNSLPESGRLYGPGSTANTPTLASAWVEPRSGVTGVAYSFRVLYSDSDNDPPQSLKVFLDADTGGVLMSRDTTFASNNSLAFSNGRYDDGELFSVGVQMFRTLSDPQHTFYFKTMDGGAEVRYPVSLLSLIPSDHPAGCAAPLYATQPKGVFCGPTVTDYKRPQPIIDLQVYDQTLDTVALQWTSPGNDEDSAAGAVSQYEIRFSTLRIVDDGRLNSGDTCPPAADNRLKYDLNSIRPTEVFFCGMADDPNRPPQTGYGGFSGVINASKSPPPPTPIAGGQTQTFTITNLNPNTAYYVAIRAEDQSGYLSSLISVSETETSVVNSSRVGPGQTDNLPPDPGTKLRTGFGMLSVPLAPSPSAVATALGDRLGTPLTMFLWIPSGEANDAGAFSQVAEIAAGKGYFVQPLSESPTLLRATHDDGTAKGTLVATAACPGGMPGGNCFTIQLSSGWNPVGNPFVEEIRLDSTYLRSTWTGSGPLYSLASAVVAGWIGQSGTLFEWVGDKYDAQKYNDPDTVTGAPSGAARLRPWHGYFLQALASGSNYLGSYDFVIRRP